MFVFYVNLVLFLMLGSWLFVCPRIWAIRGLQLWARTSVWLLRVIAGTRMEGARRQHLPEGAALVAGKHQSFWETFCHPAAPPRPLHGAEARAHLIPLFGWFASSSG